MKNQNAEVLMNKFANVALLQQKDFEFGCSFSKENNFFSAVVRWQLAPRGGWINYVHQFKLDFASLLIELQKIDSEKAASLCNTEGLSYLFTEQYALISSCLRDYNGQKDDYAALARIIFDRRGTVHASKFGI